MALNPLNRGQVFFDIETIGLTRGAGIHEAALYWADTGRLQETLFTPNMILAQQAAGDHKLISSYSDQHVRAGMTSWQQVMAKHMELEFNEPVHNLKDTLQRRAKFLSEKLDQGAYPHLLGQKETAGQNRARQQMLARAGVKQFDQQADVDIQRWLAQDLAAQFKGGETIWIANTAFESKQLGAQLSADEAATGSRNPLFSLLQTSNPKNHDPFYVTGADVQSARIRAGMTNDWTAVYKAYKANIPKTGEVAVRDVLDVTKAFMSYGQQLGMFQGSKNMYGTGIDISHQIISQAFKNQWRSTLGETHRAAEDVAVHTKYVLDKMIGLTDVLQAVKEGRGQAYLDEAKTGKGALAVAAEIFATYDQIAPQALEMGLSQRLVRAKMDLLREGKTKQYNGVQKIYQEEHLTPSGGRVAVQREKARRTEFTTMDEVGDFLDRQGHYQRAGKSAKQLWTEIEAQVGPQAGIDDFLNWENNKLKTLAVQATNAGSAAPGLKAVLGQTGNAGKTLGAITAAGSKMVQNKAGTLGAAGLALTALGALSGLLGTQGDNTKAEEPSMVSYTYKEWLAAQEGMVNQGVAKESRGYTTDFGSPYVGPVASQLVLAEQELLLEREKYLRSQYGATHYDPEQGIFAIHELANMRKYKQGGHSFITGSTAAGGKYSSLNGEGLREIDISQGGWDAVVEDADTVVLKKKGLRAKALRAIGYEQSYSFRMAGIDAPETSHGKDSYHAPQPGAMAAAEGFKAMVEQSKGKNLRMVYDPAQTTYGRMMGVMVADGMNLNFEAVKRGQAAHLPFGNPQKSMINYGSLKTVETSAFEGGKGIWAEPWNQTFYHLSQGSKERMTFNTLAKKERIVQNEGTMSAVSLMEGAQRAGRAPVEAAVEFGSAYNRNTTGRSMTGSDVERLKYDKIQRPTRSYLNDNLRQTASFTRTANNHSRATVAFPKQGADYGALNGTLALDTMGTTNNIWNKQKSQEFERYGAIKAHRDQRRSRMAEQQRAANSVVFQSGVEHHRM